MKRLTVFLFVFISTLAKAQLAQVQNVDRIIAKIDNYYILKSEVEDMLVKAKQQNQPFTRCQALESIAVQKLLVAKAEIDSVIVEEAQVSDQLDARMNEMIRMYGSEKNIVDQFSKSIETLKAEVREQVRERLTAAKMQQKITEGTRVTPNEVRKFFNRFPTDSIPMIPTEVEVQHLVRFGKIGKAQKEELIDRLKDFKKRIENGEKFEDLAAEYSEDINSRPFGGDLGFAKRGMMTPPFEATAMRMKSGELSDIVETEFGYHLIQTLEIRGQEYRARHILLRPDYNRLDLSEPKRFLDSLRAVIVKDSLRFDQQVRLHTEDENSKYSGGAIMNYETGSTRLSLDLSMEPNLYFTVEPMKEGEITQPVNYRSPDGRTGLRLIRVSKVYPTHRASLALDFEKITEYATADKSSRTIDKWFREAIGEVFIKIDPEYQSCNLFSQQP